MTVLITSYRPSVHGFRFGNDFPDQTVGPLSLAGRCHGLCAVSLDYFYAGRPAPALDIVDFGIRPVSGLGVASWSADHADLFARRDGDRLVTKRFDGTGYSGWRALIKRRCLHSPDAASWAAGRIDVVAAGPDDEMLHHWYADGWVGAGGRGRRLPDVGESLDAAFDGSPAIAAPQPGRIETYVRRADGDLWSRWYEGGWHEWVCLGHPTGVSVTSSPAAAGHRGGTTVLVRGSDGAVWSKERAGDRWRPWRSIGGTAIGAPAIATPGPGRAEAYVRGPGGNMYTSVRDGDRWDQWTSLGAPPPGLTPQRPAAVSHPGVMDVYALANNHTVWHKRWSNGWQPWQSTEVTAGGPSHRLTDAIFDRLLADTVDPLRAATPASPPAGSAGGYLTYRTQPAAVAVARAAGDEMVKLASFLEAGRPVSIGLLSDEETGHEVVVFGGLLQPGGRSLLRVYDPHHPGCDDLAIVVDPASRTITSTSGERWRALWVRDDIARRRPPV